MTVDNLTDGQMPAGFTYLGQFIDHDLTFDKSALMEGVDISPADSGTEPLAEPRSGLAVWRRATGSGLGQVLQRWTAPQGRQRRRRAAVAGIRPAAERNGNPWRRNGRRSFRIHATTRNSRWSLRSIWR